MRGAAPRIPKGSGRALKKHEAHPYTVMTVCTGNICRSPMGEIILRHEFEQRGLGGVVRVESSGVSDEEYGNPIDPRAVKVLDRKSVV